MMIYRSLVVGLLGAIALFVAGQGAALEQVAERAVGQPAEVEAGSAVPPATIVHISLAATGDDPTAALGLGGPVRVVAIDEQVVDGRWRDALAYRWDRAAPGEYFELSVANGASLGRLVVLVTP